jgi:amino acid transporter
MLKDDSKVVGVEQDDIELSDVADPLVFEKGGTKFDAHDLYRMGKLPQLRVFTSISSGLIMSNYIVKETSDFRPFSAMHAFLGVLRSLQTDFQDNACWGSVGLSYLVGLTGPVITLIGSDSARHLSEELKDAAWVLPRSMVVTAIVNYVLGFVMTITIMSTLSDIDSILSTTTGQPYVQALLNATRSRVGTSILTAVVPVMILFAAVNLVTTSSRQLFAFARDKGFPFSDFLAYVRFPHLHRV